MKSLKLKSPAKLNLYLRILNKRPDGYHNIVTVFERIDLCDDVTICRGTACRAPTIKIICSDPNVPKGPKNLAYKAAKALLDYTGKRLSCCITINKRIPIGGGLGGGSSNAATVLLGLNSFWKLKLSKKELMKIGSKIGADVSFFLLNEKFAVASGIGEKLKPIKASKPIWHVLVAPNKGLATRQIYAIWDRLYSKKGEIRPSPQGGNSGRLGTNFRHLNSGKISLTHAMRDVKILCQSILKNDLALLGANLHNDLQRPAEYKYNNIVRIKELLKACKAKNVMMSGSGCTVFGITTSRKEANNLRQRFLRQKAENNRQVFIVKTY